MTSNTIIHWFRQDLRLADNPSLLSAATHGRVLCVYVLDDDNAGEHAMGAAARWWLHHSLESLNASLDGKLAIYRGNAEEIIASLAREARANAVYWNRCYEPWRIQSDSRLKARLGVMGIETRTFNGSLLWEPLDVLKYDRTPYRVFTPYYRKGCLGGRTPRVTVNATDPAGILPPPNESTDLTELKLLPRIPWGQKLAPHWRIGEPHARERLNAFLHDGIGRYRDGRNYPGEPGNVSRLSPHLHFGEISPHQVWECIRALPRDDNTDCFCSELGWREFSHYLLYHFPDLTRTNLQSKFDRFAWRTDEDALKRWQRGQTGFPIVDAGMRELWETGYMHNRVRMIVGSFLVKNLLIHWRHGANWFWDCLVDADLANNGASWQWIAGSGADAAPYFRIFNPVTQGQKFDGAGIYTRRFIPELRNLPDLFLFNPWEAPAGVLTNAGIELGKDYPLPIVDVAQSRIRALEAYAKLSGGAG